MNIAQHYQLVNAAWPASMPKPTPQEVVRGAVKLYRYAFGRMPARVVQTSGNRYTWVRCGALHVNVDKNWQATVHDLSHFAHLRRNPGVKPHSKEHARIELCMVKEVVARGWLDGALVPAPKPPKPVVDQAAVRLKRVLELQKAWTTKHKRATTALAKLAREQRRLVKRITNTQESRP